MEKTIYGNPVLKSSYTEKEYSLVKDADIYVSCDGDDSAPGTFDNPVRTFSRAAELVREIKTTTNKEITAAFKAGEYGALKKVCLGEEDSGSEKAPVTYCAYGDGDVIFNNGVTIRKNDFSPLSEDEKKYFSKEAADKIFSFDLSDYYPQGLPEEANIFGPSEPIWEARNPNKENGLDKYYQFMCDTLDDSKKNHYDPLLKANPPLSDFLDGIDNFSGGKCSGYIMYGWRVNTFGIESYDKETKILRFNKVPKDFLTGPDDDDSGAGIRTPQMNLDEIYISNLPSLLDSDGEYWYNRKTNILYVYNPGEEYNIGIHGGFVKADNACNINFKKLSFRNDLGEDAFEMNGCRNISIDECIFEGITGGKNVITLDTCENISVSSCEFSCFTGHCIVNRTNTHLDTLKSHNIIFDNNYVHDFGLSTTFDNQAVVAGGVGMIISHNIFRNSPNGAIKLTGNEAVIEYNVFDNMMMSTQDYGIIYSYYAILNRQNQIRYNLFCNMKDRGAQYGIYFDDYSQDQCVYGNIFYKCGASGIVPHNSRDLDIHDNFFYDTNISISGGGLYDLETGKFNEKELEGTNIWEEFFKRYNSIPKEGENGYEVWKSHYPTLYAYYVDKENVSERNCIFCHYNRICDNLMVGASPFNHAEMSEKVSDFHNNISDPECSLPSVFTDAEHGDYTVREDSTFFKIPFDKIGRY